MSSEAPPPPPNETPESPEGVGEEATAAMPQWTPSSPAAGESVPSPFDTEEPAAESASDSGQPAAGSPAESRRSRFDREPSGSSPDRSAFERDETLVASSEFDREVFSPPAPSEAPTAAVAAASPVVAATPTPETPRPQLRSQGAPAGPRRVKLTLARVNVWSVTKLAFLLSVAIGIMIVVAAALTWSVLDSMEVFGRINDLLLELRVQGLLDLMQFAEFDAVLSIATLIAVFDVVLLTALGALLSLLYNITAALVGGVHVTLTDD